MPSVSANKLSLSSNEEYICSRTKSDNNKTSEFSTVLRSIEREAIIQLTTYQYLSLALAKTRSPSLTLRLGSKSNLLPVLYTYLIDKEKIKMKKSINIRLYYLCNSFNFSRLGVT